jgi:hypothetical protein
LIERKAPEVISTNWFINLLESELELEKQQPGAIISDFYEQLIFAFKDIREKNEQPISFVRQYTEFSSMMTPKDALEFELAHSYINGEQNEAAEILDFDQAAELTTSIRTKNEAKPA